MIELMVASVISVLLVGMILSIFTRMSLSYREQQQIAQVQQELASARAMFDRDAKQAGFAISQGFKIANDTGWVHSPVVVTDSSTGPDQLAFYYADPTIQAAVTSSTSWASSQITVDDASAFSAGLLVVMSTPDLTTKPNPISANDAKLAYFDACILKVGTVAGNVITFSAAAPWGGTSHCTTPAANSTMLYKFVAHAYRIDPARVGEGVLQVSPTGNLQTNTTDWSDLAYGFTDIQVSTQYFENLDVTDTADPDTDPQRDWYSDGVQATRTNKIAIGTDFIPPLQMSISLVARTDRNIEGPTTVFTPTLTVSGNAANNIIGNHAAVTLATTSDPTLTGSRIFRYTTFRVDFRNLGIGR
jgi:hypothetical protein